MQDGVSPLSKHRNSNQGLSLSHYLQKFWPGLCCDSWPTELLLYESQNIEDQIDEIDANSDNDRDNPGRFITT
jgi:hypothetical protein